ncbi:MAG: adenylate/guanylate cyclase domain-containing protein [Alphaproteobacteria bacterium]|nr:adenylate/guanylate cyclase domain-containing protein [Alphaproteobacteria bacterium]
MAPQRIERKLTTILAADAAGYSRMMGDAEEDTLRMLQGCRQVIDEFVEKHSGRVFGEAGDGALAEFASPVEAVRCAVRMQQSLAKRNVERPDDQKMQFRIGINLGDVMVDGGNLLGDGVNVAARVEGIAEPGTTFISGTVYDYVDGKIAYEFDFLGERSLKNIVRPIRVYRVQAVDMPEPGYRRERPGGSLPRPSRPSIAVLPFRNHSDDPQQAYFSEGVTEDIITELSRFRSLFVIASRSSLTYRDREVDHKGVGRELGVQFLLDGSIRRAGDKARINAQLIETEHGSRLWGERYDIDMSDFFAVQDDVIQTIVSTLAGRLESAGAESAREKPTESHLAYDHVLRGSERLNRLTMADTLKAREMFEAAIATDPRYAAAHALLAGTYLYEWLWHGPMECLDEAESLARKALSLDDNDGRSHVIFGRVQLYKRAFDAAEYHHRKSIDLNPNDANSQAHMGLMLTFFGQAEEAIEWISRAMRLNPYHPDWYCEDLGQALYVARRYEEAAAALTRVREPPYWVRAWLAAAYAQSGDVETAQRIADEVVASAPQVDWKRYIVADEPFRHDADRDHWLEGLRKAGMPV